MHVAVISYSLSGNNRKLAAASARALSAEHIDITEEKPRKTGAIILDMIFGRIPRTQPTASALERYDRLLFFAPVWMGQVASPLRPYLKRLKTHPRPYAFASISGGALNPNPKLAADVAKQAGASPAAFLDLHLTDLLGTGAKQTMKETGSYLLSDADVERLVEQLAASPVWRFCHGEG